MLDVFPDAGTIRFQKIRDAGGVLNAVIAFVRRNVRELGIGFFALITPFAIVTGIGSALYFRSFPDLFNPEALATGAPPDLGEMFGPAYFVTILGSFLAFAITQATVAAYVRLYREGEAGGISVSLLWDEAKGLILPVVGLTLVFGLAMLLSVVVNVIPCLGAIVWLGFVIWLFPYAHVAFASRMTESDSIAESIRRAMVLVKGSWGFAAGAILLTWVVTYVALMIVSVPIYTAAGVFAGLGGADPFEMMGAIGWVMVPLQVVGMAAYIMPALAAFFVHGRLAAELDGTDLEDDLDLLERGVETASQATWTEEAPAPPPSAPPTAPPPAPPVPPASENGSSEQGGSGGFRGGGFSG